MEMFANRLDMYSLTYYFGIHKLVTLIFKFNSINITNEASNVIIIFNSWIKLCIVANWDIYNYLNLLKNKKRGNFHKFYTDQSSCHINQI